MRVNIFNPIDGFFFGNGGNFPRKRHRFRRIIYSSICTLCRGCLCTIHKMDDAMTITRRCRICVIANKRSITESKLFSCLPINLNASDIIDAIARFKFFRISVSLDRSAEFLHAEQIQILNVICIHRICFSAARAFSNSSKTVPRYTSTIFCTSIFCGIIESANVQYSMVSTGLIKMFAGFIPFNFCHSFLLIYNRYKMNCNIIRLWHTDLRI